MSDANSLRSLRCPNCGAPLDFTPGQTTIRCRFCDSVFEHSAEAMTADDHARVISANPSTSASAGTPAGQAKHYIIKMSNGMPVVIEAGGGGGMGYSPSPMDAAAQAWQSGSSPSYTPSIPVITSPPIQVRGGGSRLGCILGVVITAVVLCAVVPAIVLAVSPAAALVFSQVLSGNVQQALGNAGTLGARILLDRSGIIVNGVNDAPAEAILLTTQYPASSSSTKEVRLVSVNTTTHKLTWQTAPLDQQLNDTPILANADFAFVVDNQQLLAFHRTDGTPGWQATLADKLQLNLCLDCLQLVGNRIVALTDDGTLQVFDAGTGQAQWKMTAKESSPRGLYVLGQRVAFMDSDAHNDGVLRAFDLQTGKETSAAPECKSSEPSPDHPSWTTPLYVSPKGTDFYLLFGSFAPCAQRWDAQTLKQVWSTPMPKDFSGSLDSKGAVFSADTLYLAGESDVLAFALDGSAANVALKDPDYRFQALGTHGSDVILQATSQRGTTRYAIWAVDGATGQPHWKFDLGESTSMEAGAIIGNNETEWTVQPSTDGLRVLQYRSGSNEKNYTLLVDTLNWDTGASAGQKSTPLNLDTIILTAPDWMVWKNDTLWMEMNDELLQFDAAQNKIVSSWP